MSALVRLLRRPAVGCRPTLFGATFVVADVRLELVGSYCLARYLSAPSPESREAASLYRSRLGVNFGFRLLVAGPPRAPGLVDRTPSVGSPWILI